MSDFSARPQQQPFVGSVPRTSVQWPGGATPVGDTVTFSTSGMQGSPQGSGRTLSATSASAPVSFSGTEPSVAGMQYPSISQMSAGSFADSIGGQLGAASYQEDSGSFGNLFGIDFNTNTLIFLVLVPVVVWILLFTLRPNFVTDLVNGERVINTSKLILWTLIISVLVWILWGLATMAWKNY